MTIRQILLFLADFLILSGLYQFYFRFIIRKGYEVFKEEDESFIDYIAREYQLTKWQKRVNQDFSLDTYFRIRSILGIILILIGVFLIGLIWFLAKTKYGFIIDVRL